jgi:hypothetical protein
MEAVGKKVSKKVSIPNTKIRIAVASKPEGLPS